jgi:hypothetical protein
MRDNKEQRIHVRAVAEIRLAFFRAGAGDAPIFHCANEGKRQPQYRRKLSALGLAKGIPDLIIMAPTATCSAAALEIKAPTGRASAEQMLWLSRFGGCGFAVACTAGHRATAIQLELWGYITEAQRDLWIADILVTDADAA